LNPFSFFARQGRAISWQRDFIFCYNIKIPPFLEFQEKIKGGLSV